MNVTDGDRERARQVIDALSPEAAYVDEFVYDGDVQPLHDAIAAALAEERERARAPFLALARRYGEEGADSMRQGAGVYSRIAREIRHAARETE